jgi:transcriptional regulator with XRE-family HTH domain
VAKTRKYSTLSEFVKYSYLTFKTLKTTINALMRTFNLLSSNSICTELGERIRRLRLAQNLSQLQLAQMTQSSLSSVRRLEALGQGSFEFVVRVAQALQAIDIFDTLFMQPVQSIAQAERELNLAQRQRARLPRAVLKTAVP